MSEPYWGKSGVVYPKFGDTTSKAVQGYAYIHPCFVEGCTNYAPFGVGFSYKRKKLGTWACREHRHLLPDRG